MRRSSEIVIRGADPGLNVDQPVTILLVIGEWTLATRPSERDTYGHAGGARQWRHAEADPSRDGLVVHPRRVGRPGNIDYEGRDPHEQGAGRQRG